MAGRLKFPYICLSIFLPVLPLVCSEEEENNGKNDMKELLQNLLKAEKERRQLLVDTNVQGSGGTEQRHTGDGRNVPDIETQKVSKGVLENDVKEDNEIKQKIIQDCENIKIDYQIGKEIENTTLLSIIKGIDGCMGKAVLEMIEISEQRRGLDEYEKRLIEK